jgi:DNA-binding NtrC family response regulator
MQMQASGVVGNSAASVDTYHRLFQIAELCRRSPLPIVLIEGEMGSGKGIHGEALHRITGREGEPQKVPMATVAPERAESILFGHIKGAFTGATDDFKGCFENCSGGTVILDDINHTPPSCHAKLLTVLEDRTVTPLGSNEIRPVVDTLIVVTTNQDLREAGLPDDIIQRLTGNRLRIPDLGSRYEDVPALVEHFLDKHGLSANCLSLHRENIAHKLRRVALDSKISIRDVRNAISQLVQDSQEIDLRPRDHKMEARIAEIEAAARLVPEGGGTPNKTQITRRMGHNRNYFHDKGPWEAAYKEWQDRCSE